MKRHNYDQSLVSTGNETENRFLGGCFLQYSGTTVHATRHFMGLSVEVVAPGIAVPLPVPLLLAAGDALAAGGDAKGVRLPVSVPELEAVALTAGGQGALPRYCHRHRLMVTS